jgi:ADP-heptose:LPS heptosyltransferase
MHRLLVLHQGAIGDFLLTLSVVQAARTMLAAEAVVAVASAASARVAAGRSDVDTWIGPDEVGLYRLFCGDLPLSDRLAGILDHADVVLNFLGGPTEAIHQRLVAASKGRVISVDPRPTPETREARRHITAQWTDDVRRAGLPIPDPEPARIRFPARRTGLFRALIHPGSGGRGKCWPLDRFVAVAGTLAQCEAIWMLGPAEVEEARRVQVCAESLLVEEDLVNAAEAMSGCDFYIGNDSGMTHLASALGLPTVAIYGTTDPYIWRPLGEQVLVVAPAEPQETMDAVSVEQVQKAVSAIIRQLEG